MGECWVVPLLHSVIDVTLIFGRKIVDQQKKQWTLNLHFFLTMEITDSPETSATNSEDLICTAAKA